MMVVRYFAFAFVLVAACSAEDDGGMRPIAVAGFDRSARPGESVRLDGSDSDADVTFAWSLAQRPQGSNAALSEASSATPAFTPDAVGAYMVALVVTRDGLSSLPDVVVVEASNGSAVAVAACGAGSGCLVTHEREAALDGRASYDPDGDALTYNWSQITTEELCATACPELETCNPSSAPAVIANATTPLASFIAPDADAASLVFQLSVNDGTSLASSCIVYTTRNSAPTAALAPSAGTVNPLVVDEGTAFVLNGAASGDPDGDTLTFAWTQLASSFTAAIATPLSQATSVVAPAINATPGDLAFVDLVFTLAVSDGLASDSVEITIRVMNNP